MTRTHDRVDGVCQSERMALSTQHRVANHDRPFRPSGTTEPVAIPRHTWKLSQIETHTLRQLVGVVLINCQLAQRGTLTDAEAVQRCLEAIVTQQTAQYEAFRTLFASTPDLV